MLDIDSQITAFLPEANIIYDVISVSVYILLFGAIAFLIYKKDIFKVFQITFGAAVAFLIVQIIKIIISRERPNGFDLRSFPSQHTAFAFFLASVLPVKRKEERIVLYGWAVLVSLSRMVLLEHWFTDVLVGAIIGLGAGYLVKSKNVKKALAE
ncbi:MAG: phosphatase PAP2 family protein [DPANN group archaeon]|nr:phosphatase PAP2 family protein [DPANN group archaeon]